MNGSTEKPANEPQQPLQPEQPRRPIAQIATDAAVYSEDVARDLELKAQRVRSLATACMNAAISCRKAETAGRMDAAKEFAHLAVQLSVEVGKNASFLVC